MIAACRGRARAILADLKANNPKQHALVTDQHTHCSGCCPRRAGKTYCAVCAALVTGEAKPGAISIIISLNKAQLRRLYWDGPTGLQALARKYKVRLEFYSHSLKWVHENGSYGYLLGADDDEQLEVLRGLEADLYVIDECQAFAPAKLEKLLTSIIEPQRASRQGKVMLIGTPGYLAAGPFWQATCPDAMDAQGRKYLVFSGQADSHGRDVRKARLWSFHHWTLQDNAAMPHQWDEALITKEVNGWGDEHPSWLAEYMGYWTLTQSGLVYRYASERGSGRLNWTPQRTKENPSGLPPEGAPWRYIAGLDIGFEDATAFVVCAYSAKLKQLRHVWDVSKPHMLVDDVAALIAEGYARFGSIERIYADVGNLGKMVVETLIARYGFPIEKAEKREKFDHIELLNSAFARGEVVIIEGTELHQQLLKNAWNLKDGTKEQLAREGRLREDPSIPNDSTDALLYLYRGSLHHFGQKPVEPPPEYGTPEWKQQRARDELRAFREQFKQASDARLGDNRFSRAPLQVQRALTRDKATWMPPTPSSSKRS